MTLKTKIFALFAAMMASKHSIAASSLTGIVGAYFATTLGFDPWPWVLGILGGVIIRVKLPPTSRLDGLVNGAISVVLGGVVAPWGAVAMSASLGPAIAPNAYVLSFALACLWPWIANIINQKSGDVWDGVMKKWGLK